MSMNARTIERKRRIVANVARSFDEAERWDLEYWLAKTPEERLSALVAIRRDVAKVLAARPSETQK